MSKPVVCFEDRPSFVHVVRLMPLLLTDFVCIRYGDKCPKSVVARVFSIIWILLGLIIMAIFTANITSALTALSLQPEPSSLVGAKVGLILCQLAGYVLLSVSKNAAQESVMRRKSARYRSSQSLDSNAMRKSLRGMLAFVVFLYGYL